MHANNKISIDVNCTVRSGFLLRGWLPPTSKQNTTAAVFMLKQYSNLIYLNTVSSSRLSCVYLAHTSNLEIWLPATVIIRSIKNNNKETQQKTH